MIVPDYWAEARKRFRDQNGQITVRRFGWSLSSFEDAQAMAERRAEQALERLRKGEKIARSEPKIPYNGGEGVPIREEVLFRDREEVITRNAYGAHCLNSPHALFADVDFHAREPVFLSLYTFAVLAFVSALIALWQPSWIIAIALGGLSLLGSVILPGLLSKVLLDLRGGPAVVFSQRLHKFMQAHPDWAVRVYRTPAGMRLLATHRPFDANEPAVKDFFRALKVDPVYARMCRNQNCFRARLTAKPWRIGIEAHMRPRPGVWPVHADRMAQREAWIASYEAQAAAYAACEFVEALGSGVIHEAVRTALELHDERSGALDTHKPLA